MGARKFFAGDTVVIDGPVYPIHHGHQAEVIGVRIVRINEKGQRLNYHVQCECGKVLFPTAPQISGPVVTNNLDDDTRIYEARVKYLFGTIGLPYQEDVSVIEQIAQLLGSLDARQRDIIQRRFGLLSGPQTFQDIGNYLGVSKQYVKQLEARALKKLAR